jgi:hypothetical protein
MTEYDEKIAALHVRMVRAQDACHDSEAEYWRVEISDVEDARDEAARVHRRQLSKDYATANWSGDADAAALIQAEIEKFERGQS